MLRFRAGDASAAVDPNSGGRLATLCVDGLELLVSSAEAGDDPLLWGSYPMVPFAGRIGDGRFSFGAAEVHLPATLGDHAIHGYGHTSVWETTGSDTLRLPLGPPWPFGGVATQRFGLHPDRLEFELVLEATTRPLPATVGWHPWFRRELASGGPVEVSFAARYRYERDDRHLPTGALVEPGEGPWDDCFTELGPPPQLLWPGALRLTVEHDCSHLVVYTEPDHAVCVEPQTGPPDAFNLDPDRAAIEPGHPLAVHVTLRWG